MLSLVSALALVAGAMAQMGPANPVVPQSEIQFWTGSGSNRAVVAITWNDSTAGNIGIAWGVQWDGNDVTTGSLMDTIAAYDSRLTVSGSSASFITNFTYTDATLGLNLTGPDGWWWYNWTAADGTAYSSFGVTADTAVNGDFIDWLPMDDSTFNSYTADTMIMATIPDSPVDPQPEEATIAASDILYWVGTGANEAILAVNWADTALAWGYRFDGTKSVSDMMNDIAAADPRFNIEMGDYGIEDIVFAVAPGDTLRKQAYSYWESKNNGSMDAGMGQSLLNGDFEKWAEPAAGTVVDSSYYEGWGWSYSYIYTMAIHPVSVPNTEGITGLMLPGSCLTVFPTPAVTSVTVSFDALESATGIELFDMAGRRVAFLPVAAGSTAAQVAVGHLANGTYLLRMADSTVKVVVGK